MIDVHVSNHAMKRLRKRVGLSKKASFRIAQKAYKCGLRQQDVSGSFKRYLDGLFLKEKTATNVRVFGNHVYLFGETTLITVLTLPLKYRKYTNITLSQKKGL